MSSLKQALYSAEIQKQLDSANAAVDHWEYRTLPAVRFIGLEVSYEEFGGYNGDHWAKIRGQAASALDRMPEYASGFDYDLTLAHHFGKRVEAERCHEFIGRFMKAGTPAPEGFVYWDFVPDGSGTSDLTFCSQFAFAVFSGREDDLHVSRDFDVCAMYDITRNIIMEQKVSIPYPEMYWTAEVQFDRADGTEYNPEKLYGEGEGKSDAEHCGWLFSVRLNQQ